MKIKNLIFLLLYSFLFIPIWGLLFLDASTSNNFNVFIGLLYTVISSYFIQSKPKFYQIKHYKKYIIFFPLIYGIASVFASPKDIILFLHPVLWGLLVLIINVYFIKDLKNYSNLFFFLFISYFYAYPLYTYWNQYYEDGPNIERIEHRNLDDAVNLLDFQFLNKEMDTVNLSTTKSYIFIETWNENCGPCIKSIRDLQPLLDKYKNKADHYYLYEKGNSRTGIGQDAIFNFSPIQNKNKILIDLEQNLFHELGMKSFPYFLLFNQQGELVDYFVGYKSSEKEYFENRIKEMLEKDSQ